MPGCDQYYLMVPCRVAKSTSIILGDYFASFVDAEVDSGRFGTTSEVVRAGLRLLEAEEKKLAALRGALEAGEKSGLATGNPFTRVRRKVGLKSKRG